MDCSIASSTGEFATGSASGTACLIDSLIWDGAHISNKGRLLVSRTSKGGDIFLSFSYRDAHHIARGCFSLASRLPARDSCPLLAFDNVRMDPYCLSLRSRDKSFLPLVVRISIDHSKFPFQDGSYSGASERFRPN